MQVDGGAAKAAQPRRCHTSLQHLLRAGCQIWARRSTAGLGRWAAEVARHGTFAAPLPEHQAAGALGSLPVPYLNIANKADLAGAENAWFVC